MKRRVSLRIFLDSDSTLLEVYLRAKNGTSDLLSFNVLPGGMVCMGDRTLLPCSFGWL